MYKRRTFFHFFHFLLLEREIEFWKYLINFDHFVNFDLNKNTTAVIRNVLNVFQRGVRHVKFIF